MSQRSDVTAELIPHLMSQRSDVTAELIPHMMSQRSDVTVELIPHLKSQRSDGTAELIRHSGANTSYDVTAELIPHLMSQRSDVTELIPHLMSQRYKGQPTSILLQPPWPIRREHIQCCTPQPYPHTPLFTSSALPKNFRSRRESSQSCTLQ